MMHVLRMEAEGSGFVGIRRVELRAVYGSSPGYRHRQSQSRVPFHLMFYLDSILSQTIHKEL